MVKILVRSIFTALLVVLTSSLATARGKEIQEKNNKINFYVIKLHKEIDKSSARMFTDALKEAQTAHTDYVILNLNTYGGALDAADSIRTAIMQCQIPVISFVNIQAASAGALISIACDSIYMRNGSSIGAATVEPPPPCSTKTATA